MPTFTGVYLPERGMRPRAVGAVSRRVRILLSADCSGAAMTIDHLRMFPPRRAFPGRSLA